MSTKYVKQESEDVKPGTGIVKNVVAAVVALLFVVATGYFAFNYFNNVTSETTDGENNIAQTINLQNILGRTQPATETNSEESDIIASSTVREDETTATEQNNGQVAGTENSTDTNVAEPTITITPTPAPTPTPTVVAQNPVTPTTESTGTVEQDNSTTTTETVTQNNSQTTYSGGLNDYQPGDISGSSYQVQSGDTLWEIAEAVYGNGADWVQLLNANSNDVGYLANGSQALIVPGQVLTIPTGV